MYRYGFELEAFAMDDDDNLYIPPKDWPCDGFPGLVEIRTDGHNTLDQAYYNLFHEMRKHNINQQSIALKPSATFSADQKRQLRKERPWNKQQVDVQNIYGKKPRSLGNKTIASFQINISFLECLAYTTEKGIHYRDRFGLLDVPRIVRALDTEFEIEIGLAGRQAGEYCIKSPRLEYRSLPNNVFQWENWTIQNLLNRIEKSIEP